MNYKEKEYRTTIDSLTYQLVILKENIPRKES